MLLAAWLKTHMGLPFGKVAELLGTMAGLTVSPGALSQGLKSLAREFADETAADVLGEEFDGVLGCDFYSAYNGIYCLKQRCLAHLMRDLRAALEGRGPGLPARLD